MEFWSRSWEVMEFDVGEFICSKAAWTVLDCLICMREITLNYDKM